MQAIGLTLAVTKFQPETKIFFKEIEECIREVPLLKLFEGFTLDKKWLLRNVTKGFGLSGFEGLVRF